MKQMKQMRAALTHALFTSQFCEMSKFLKEGCSWAHEDVRDGDYGKPFAQSLHQVL
jgi:pentose-5-phosphate-3-epimerase